MNARANALAHALVARGVERGDRVVVFADNTIETAVAFWAVLKANAVVSIVNAQTKSDKLSYLLQDCRATALISDAHLWNAFFEPAKSSKHLKSVIVSREASREKLDALPGAVSWDEALASGDLSQPPRRACIDVDLAAIIYTSGSTGDPKGVMLTHRNMLTAATSISTYLENVEDDVILGVLPLSFDYGLYQMIMAFRMGARLVLERSFTYPAQVLATMVAEGVTGFPGVPTIFAILAEMKSLRDYDFSKIRYVTNTAAALPVKHILLLKQLFPDARIFSMYGLTECKRCTYLPPEDIDRKPSSVGIAIPNTELWIVDDQDRRLGPNEVGQLVIRGATVMRGYWEKPEATAKKLRPGPLPGELVLYTGDFCKTDDEGYLHFVGRMDDIIKSRGEKVAPKEVENALMDIRGVKEAAVIGVPDDILGQAIKAFVVLEAGAQLDEKAIQRECFGRLENFMVPKHVAFVSDLPKTTTGKIKKIGLGDAATTTTASPAPLAYARGLATFMGIELLAARGALVPRAETELLGRAAVDAVAAVAKERGDALVVDMCAGSGNLACAIAMHVPAAKVWASELTDDAVALARRNVDKLDIGARVHVVQGDLFAPLMGRDLDGSVDVIVCNPPYISSGKLASDHATLLEHEPREAFDGGPYGLSIHQRVIKEALPLLREGGWLMFEIGLGQDRQMQLLLERSRAYRDIELVRDDAGNVRVVKARFRTPKGS
jgi:HemK-like putative methylase